MKKNLLLYILLAFLLIVNGFFLFNHLSKPSRKGPRGPGNFIVKELQFNKDQLNNFDELNNQHHKKMRVLSDDLRKLKDELFSKISMASVDENEIDSLTTLIGKKEKEKETEIFSHFRNVQDICNEKQKEKFKMIIKDALRRGGDRGQRPPGSRRPDERRPPPPKD